MSKLFMRVIACSFLFLPMLAFAQGSTGDTTEVFALPATDPSIIFLGQIFGTVGGGTVNGTSGQLVGTLFKYFNLGILSIAGVFMVWTTVKLVLETSAQGSFMGREGKAAMTVIRTVAGLGMLVPSGTTGYSIVQVIVMWAVVQGCGFANTMWNKALDYFASGGQVFVAPSMDLTNVVTMTGSVMEAQVCMYYHEKMYNAQKTAAQARVKAGTASPLDQQLASQFISSFTPHYNAQNNTVNFPSALGNSPNDIGCGSINWSQSDPNNNAIVATALTDVIDTNASAARRIVSPTNSDLTVVDPSTGATQIQETASSALLAAASDWTNLLIPLRAQAQDPTQLNNFMKDARKAGWIFAGSYYYNLARIQRNMNAASSITVKLATPPLCLVGVGGGYLTFPTLGVPNACTNALPGLSAAYSNAANYVANAQGLALAVSQQGTATANFSLDVGALVGLAILLPLILPLAIGLPSVFSNMSTQGDPIMKLQTMGNTLMGVVLACWIVGSVIMFIMSVIMSLMSSMLSFGFALRDALSVVLPLLMGFLAILFVQGAVIAVYVPLIPFIVFTFTVLGWFIVVIEAMAAAPLVALGVTHPEGHDWLGKSEQAVMLLLSVFLRPALMILGLLSAMLLSTIMLQIVNIGFVTAVGGTIGFLTFIATFTIYVSLVMQVITQSYALIYLVPDRVMKWIGVGVESPQGATQALKGAQEKAQGMGELGGGAGKSMMEASKSSGKQLGENASANKEGSNAGGKSASQIGAHRKKSNAGASTPSSSGGASGGGSGNTPGASSSTPGSSGSAPGGGWVKPNKPTTKK